jgi:hypothetical protein
MHYTGLVQQTSAFKQAAEANKQTNWNDQYMRLMIHFDTGAERYRWLNSSLFVAKGRLLGTGHIEYTVAKVTVVHVHEGGQAIVANMEGEWDADQIEKSTPCSWICTGPNVAEREHGAGSRASPQRWQTVGAECVVAPRREHQRAIGMRSSTVAMRQRQVRDGGRFRL